MCQSRAQGGRRCPAHQPATLGLKDFCRTVFGLKAEQVDHTFRRLRQQGSQYPAPTMEEYQHLVDRTKRRVLNNVHDDRDKARINRQLDKVLEQNQLPDGATFYAMKKMIARSRDQKNSMASMIRQFCHDKGVSRTQAYRLFQQHYAQLEGHSESSNLADEFDSRTRQAFNLMNDDPVNRDVISDEPRITRDQSTDHASEFAFGYDPDDGRLEIEQNGQVHAFHNVPAELVERFRAAPYPTLMHLTQNNFYQYTDAQESESDAYGRWCHECHSYRAASGHICEPNEESEPNPMLMDVTDEASATMVATAPATTDQDMTLEGAQSRIRAALAERNENNAIPSRARIRMSANRRRWVSPLEGRETVTLENTVTGHAAGGNNRTYNAPDPQEVKRLARDGKIVEVHYERNIVSQSYAREFDADPNVTMTHDLKFYCDDITGDVKCERVGNPRCNCEEYRQNYRCRHICSTSDPNTMNRLFNKDLNDYFSRVDPMSKARQDAMNGQYVVAALANRVTYDTFEGERVSAYLPNQTSLRHAKEILTGGGRVQVTNHEHFGQVGNRDVTGSLVFEGSTENVGVSVINNMKCRYCDEAPCEHGQKLARFYASRILPDDAVVLDSASRLQQLDSIDRSDWQSNNEDVNDVLSTFSVGIDRSYTANLDKYISDYREAREKIARGENPLPYERENVTNGVCAPGQKAFGIEIEFDLPARGREAALERIAREMYDAGLSEEPYMQRWHYNGRTATPYSHWSLERDSTVAGEIVSPILHDTPETWDNLQKICDIVKRNGGQASVNAGQHVHMGTVNRSQSRRQDSASLAQKNANILHFYAANEDSIRRVQTDPARRTHRNTRYCSPLAENSIQNSLYHFRHGSVNLGSDHSSSVNFGFNDRIEFRGADASLDPAHIQAQVMLCSGVVAAAERGELPAGENFDRLKHQRVGTNARRLNAIRLTDENEEMSDDELIVSDASFRNFITSIFPTDHGRKMMVAIAANTPWQR